MFQDLEQNKKVLIGAYRKLKGYYYYNKSMLYMRKIIAEFEWDFDEFDKTFNKLANLLFDPTSKENIEYIENMISKISYVILPKSFVEKANKSEITLNDNKFNKELSEVNFFIKPPIELLILDTLWTTFIGKIAYDNRTVPNYSYGNILKYNKLFYDKIDFDTSSMFEFYFYQYTKWRDNAFKEIEKSFDNKKNTLFISIDLKSYYYSARFKFNKLSEMFGEHKLFEVTSI